MYMHTCSMHENRGMGREEVRKAGKEKVRNR
jgi:hypothetical protein